MKSGGHAAFAGASSIDDGITVDLKGLGGSKLSDDRKTVAVGPGNRWYDVYAYLNSSGLAVVGGRASTVGVGGLTVRLNVDDRSSVEVLTCNTAGRWHLAPHQ